MCGALCAPRGKVGKDKCVMRWLASRNNSVKLTCETGCSVWYLTELAGQSLLWKIRRGQTPAEVVLVTGQPAGSWLPLECPGPAF